MLFKLRISGKAESETDSDDEHSFEFCRNKVMQNTELQKVIIEEQKQRRIHNYCQNKRRHLRPN